MCEVLIPRLDVQRILIPRELTRIEGEVIAVRGQGDGLCAFPVRILDVDVVDFHVGAFDLNCGRGIEVPGGRGAEAVAESYGVGGDVFGTGGVAVDR